MSSLTLIFFSELKLFLILRVPIMIYCIFVETENLQRLQKPHTSMLRIVYS